ncbi:PEP-CTERM sorting domain-containing protein [Opitutaceae bacterium EW11]|nr:PEP-CTERM sorting domain-containing protein [Opitutaceae bacterium EW11]
MNTSSWLWGSRLTALGFSVGLGLTPLTTRAQLSFDLIHDPSMNAQALAGFQMAANRWSSVLQDHVTVTINIGFSSLGAGILGQTGSTGGWVDYSSFKLALAYDATSKLDVSAVTSLQPGSSFSMLINRTADNPNGPGSAVPYLDNDGSDNNSYVRMTIANARALGLYSSSGGASDGTIRFNSDFAFDFDPTDGIDADKIDFVGVATHEIGHALGFISGVDTLTYNSPPFGGPYPSDAFVYVSPLDFFRYSVDSRAQGKGVIDYTADTRMKYFSVDGGNTGLALFSTGESGDGWQASHWIDNWGYGIMDPAAAYGELLSLSKTDVAAFDAIGWDTVRAVPEPSTYGLIGAGMLGLAMILRRRRVRR